MGGRWVCCRVVFWTGSGFRAGGALRGGGGCFLFFGSIGGLLILAGELEVGSFY